MRITIEGAQGAGKTTVALLIAQTISDQLGAVSVVYDEDDLYTTAPSHLAPNPSLIRGRVCIYVNPPLIPSRMLVEKL